MLTAKVFENGRSQAVRLPKGCRFNVDEVAVKRIGDVVILMPKTDKWVNFMIAIDMFSADFMEAERNIEKQTSCKEQTCLNFIAEHRNCGF